jgi:hypothetical protein
MAQERRELAYAPKDPGMKPTIRESEIQRTIMDYLEASGVLHWRVCLGGVRRRKGVRSRNPMKGFPDLAGIVPHSDGKFFVIEVKRPGQELREEQSRWRNSLEAQGVCYILATSVADVVLKLMEIK